MDNEHKKILRKNRVALAKDLILGELLQLLVQKQTLNDHLVEKVDSKPTSFEKNVQLLILLPKLGPTAFPCFIEALIEAGQHHLVELLTPNNLLQNNERSYFTPTGNMDSETFPLMPSDAISNTIPSTIVSTLYKSNESNFTFDPIVISTSTGLAIDLNDCYHMSSPPRRMALIISVERFDPSARLDHRQGGEVDRSRLESVLCQLAFQCYTLVDGTGREIWDVLLEFVEVVNRNRCDVSMLVVMSHGEKQCFFGRDGTRVHNSRVIELFDNEHCKGLHNKPKVLVFHTCRGNVIDRGVNVSDGRRNCGFNSAPEADMISNSSIGGSMPSNRLPHHSDCLVCHATVKGYAAIRDTAQGSWYMQALIHVLAEHAWHKDITEMMTIVNNLVKLREGDDNSANEYHRCKEMPIFQSTLCKKLYLLPGRNQYNAA